MILPHVVAAARSVAGLVEIAPRLPLDVAEVDKGELPPGTEFPDHGGQIVVCGGAREPQQKAMVLLGLSRSGVKRIRR